jgi:stage IV sporulation protein FB
VLVEPPRTQYDVTFRLFGFAVRVHPFFWVFMALLGSNALDDGLPFLLIWIAAAFISILIHELGHALAFRRYGTEASIVLYAFGGQAIPWHAVAGRWRRVAVALAGPIAGFILYGLVYGSHRAFGWAGPEASPLVREFYLVMLRINLYWGILNLLPVYPLDGGHVCRELCTMWSRRNGTRIAFEISIAFAGLVALYSIACAIELREPGGGWLIANKPKWLPPGTVFTGILFAVLAVENYMMLRQRDWTEPHWDYADDDRPPWK